jgi:chloride channel protein, CIC family
MTERFARALRIARLAVRRFDFLLARRFALTTREDRAFFLLIPVVGLLSGAVGILVQRSSEWVRVSLWGYWPTFEEAARHLPGWRIVLALVVGGAAVALLQKLFREPLGGHGVSALIEAVVLHGGKLSVRPILGSAVASIAAVGAGGSLGREGPMLRLGEAIASWLGERAGLGSYRLKILLGCGTAAGFAAAYNVPIGGSLFAMEVVLGSFALEIFGPIVLSALIATLLARAAESAAPIYAAPGYGLTTPWEIVAFLVLGVFGALAAVAFTRVIDVTGRVFRGLKVVPRGVQPILGMAMVGVLAIAAPEVAGNGFSVITSALHGEYALKLLLIFAALKLLATALTDAGGCPGGHFTPSLCFGALLGGAYAAVGMAAVAAGASHAPLSAMLILFEVTGNYDLVPALMAGTLVSAYVAKRIYPYSVYTARLAKRGAELRWRLEEAALAGLTVDDLVLEDRETLAPGDGYATVVERFFSARRQRLYVVGGDGRLLGSVSLHDIKHTLRDSGELAAVVAHDLMRPVPTVLKRGERLHRAAEAFARSDFERLPVLAEDGVTYVGVVTKRDLLAVYAQEVLGRPTVLSTYVRGEQPETGRLELPPDFAVRSVPLPPELDGRTLAEARLPQRLGVRVLQIKRRGAGGEDDWLLPEARTVLAAGDLLVLLGPTAAVEALVAGRMPDGGADGEATRPGLESP